MLLYPWKRIQSPKIDPLIYSQMIFYHNVKVIQWGKNNFQKNGGGTTFYHDGKKDVS